MPTQDIILTLNPKQHLALTIPTKRLLLTGGIRAGKTTLALIKIKEIATRMPGSQILVMRKTLKEIRDDIFKSLYNPNDGLLATSHLYGRLNKSNYEHSFPNGSKILYRQADDERKLLGLDLSCIYFEQAENISKKIFEYALGRLTHWGDIRNPQSRGYRYIQKYNNNEYVGLAKRPAHFFIMSCNPDTGSWIYDDIIRTCKDYDHTVPHIKHQDLNWDIINFQTTDNSQLPDVYNYIEEQRQSTSDSYFRRMIMGEWTSNEGLIYSHFINDKHIISDWSYDSEERYEIIVGIDPGNSWYTGVVFVALDKKTNNYILFDEIKIRSTIISDICDLIKAKLLTYKIKEDKVRFVIDSAANIQESNGISKSDQYKQNKIYVINAIKTLEGSLERINGLFKQNRIFICGNNISVLRDLKSYRFAENGKPDKGVGEKAFDMMDCMRYALNQFAQGSNSLKEAKPIERDPVKRTQIHLTNIFNNIGYDDKISDDDVWGI